MDRATLRRLRLLTGVVIRNRDQARLGSVFQAVVQRNPVRPCCQRRLASVCGHALEQGDKNLLSQVFGVGLTRRIAPGQPVQARAVGVHERSPGTRSAARDLPCELSVILQVRTAFVCFY